MLTDMLTDSIIIIMDRRLAGLLVDSTIPSLLALTRYLVGEYLASVQYSTIHILYSPYCSTILVLTF